MSYPPIVLFDFDGVIITQKALEYTASFFLKKKFYNWQNTENMRLIDCARLFEESDSKNRSHRQCMPFLTILEIPDSSG